MQWLDLLAPTRVLASTTTSKKRLLETLATLLSDGQGGALEGSLFEGLCARERLGSTGLGHGVAIPHGRVAGLGSAIGAFVRLAEPVDFGAPDGQPVDLVFALAVPEHFTHQHLVLLSELAERFSSEAFRAALRAAPDATALLQVLREGADPRNAAA